MYWKENPLLAEMKHKTDSLKFFSVLNHLIIWPVRVIIQERSKQQQHYSRAPAHYPITVSGIIMTLCISAVQRRQMHSHAVSDTEQDVCACLYSLPVISILAAGDKTQSLSVRLQMAFCQETSGQNFHTSNTTMNPCFTTIIIPHNIPPWHLIYADSKMPLPKITKHFLSAIQGSIYLCSFKRKD